MSSSSSSNIKKERSFSKTENPEFLAIQHLDQTSVSYQKQNKYIEALECMEKGLILKQHFYGPDSFEVLDACKVAGDLCNILAMSFIQQEKFPKSLELLKKAEILTEKDMQGRAVTLNNLACFYRRNGKLHAAILYLKKALAIEAQLLPNVMNAADTHINACAVLSQLGRHQQALEHAQSALLLLQEEMLQRTGSLLPPSSSSSSLSIVDAESEHPSSALTERYAVLAIAYHNTGVEQEFLKRFEQSIEYYSRGLEVAEQYLGNNHAIVATIKDSLEAAQKVAEKHREKVSVPKAESLSKSTLGLRSTSNFSKSLSKSPYL